MAEDLIKDKSQVKFAKLLFNKGTDDALSFHCLIKDIKDDYVNFIGISNYSDPVEIGSQINIRIYSTNGIVDASATLLKTYKVGNLPLYVTTYPKTYDYTKKRAYYRADLHLPIELLVVLPNGSTKKIKATTKNISGRGMCYISLDEKFPEYFSITTKIRFKNRSVVTTADHIYTNPVKYKDEILYIHAFKFIGIEPEDINFIVKECFLTQINKKHVNKIR